MSVNKRRHARVPIGITMNLRIGKGDKKCRGTIADLSVSGMTFESDVLLEEGQSLCLKMNTPLEIRGEVRHIKAAAQGGMHRYGVRFHFVATQKEQSTRDL